ncbi:MAG: hypothetical protein IJ015_02920 [Ruminococcus sp.]|nr:hypothetical protein [Ruminococcus sp.]
MSILEDLYYGNVSPCDRDVKRGSKVDELQNLVCHYEVELSQTLTQQQKETFEKFKETYSELCCCFERDMFAQGFIIATKIIIEVIGTSNSDPL